MFYLFFGKNSYIGWVIFLFVFVRLIIFDFWFFFRVISSVLVDIFLDYGVVGLVWLVKFSYIIGVFEKNFVMFLVFRIIFSLKVVEILL